MAVTLNGPAPATVAKTATKVVQLLQKDSLNHRADVFAQTILNRIESAFTGSSEPVAEWLNLQNRTVEPVFGQPKQTQGTDRFLVRCKQVVRGE